MLINEIIAQLEILAPPSLQESYDNAGLLTGSGSWEVSKALICLDSTEEVIDEAIKNGCNLVIAHHPIIFNGLKKITGRNYIERTIIKAIKNDIAIYAIHTNLDNVRQGVNAKIAAVLGLNDTFILSPKSELLRKLVTFCPVEQAEKVRNAIFEAGAGHIGNYDSCSFNVKGIGTFRGNEQSNPFVGEQGTLHQEEEERIEVIYPDYLENKILQALHTAHPYEEVAYDIYPLKNKFTQTGSGICGDLKTEIEIHAFLQLVKERFNAGMIRYTNPVKAKIKKIAVCGGSGSFLLKDAIAAGADAFITADFKYHQFFDADNNLIIIDIGHYESEQFTSQLLFDYLQQKFPTFALVLSKTKTNPINYC
jgi:dinuclear metal center YbgI/SA1388 family protein